MKIKNLFSMLAMVGMLFATSCSQDDVVNSAVAGGDYVDATFTIGTADGMGTRTIGDGTTVDKVACAVYDADADYVELDALYKIEDVTNKKAVYNVRLAKGKTYRVAFFAYNEAANAYDVEDLKNIGVNDNQLSNVEGRDAFTAYVDIETGETMNAFAKEVILKRPFAQLNLGIDDTELKDAENAGLVVAESKIVVSNVYKAFSAFEDKVVGSESSMTFDLNEIPEEKLIVDGVEYNYLALNYILVGDKGFDKSLTDVEFVWKEAGENGGTNNPTTKFLNVPVQRNYRTNILGKLLTSPATFNIVIDETFDADIYRVASGEELNDALANAGGCKILLTEGVNYGTITAGNLKNVVIKGAENAAVRFVTTADSKIENVTIENIEFEYTGDEVNFGIVINKDAKIENLVIENSTFVGTGEKKGRGIYGQNPDATIVLKGCTFSNMGYPVYTMSAGGYKSLLVEGCTFELIKSWAIMPQYNDYLGDLTVTDCEFVDCTGGLVKAGSFVEGTTFTFTNNTITNSAEHPSKNWFTINTSAATKVVSGNVKDGVEWVPGEAEGLK